MSLYLLGYDYSQAQGMFLRNLPTAYYVFIFKIKALRAQVQYACYKLCLLSAVDVS